MRSRQHAWVLHFVLLTWFSLIGTDRPSAHAAGNETKPAGADKIGWIVPNVQLRNILGEPCALDDSKQHRVLVLVQMTTQCPIGNRYVPILKELQGQLNESGVQIALVYAYGQTLEQVKKHVAEFQIDLPAVLDDHGTLAELTGATRTAEVVVLDSRRAIRYRGRIDDRIGYQHQRDEPSRHDLREAIREVLDRKEVSVKETAVAGCLLNRPGAAPTGEVTYFAQVAPIVQNKCQSCHRETGAAPFALANADDAVNWAATIKQVVLEQRMPPWHADPRHGKFANDRSLTEAERDTLVRWVDSGTPLGNSCKAPEPKKFADNWTIGEPDLVFEMPKDVTIPAKGVMPYQYFETETNFKQDVWIQAAEARPGNRAVVHHIIVFYKEPNADKRKIGEQWIAGTAPGDMSLVLPPGVARKVPAGSKLIWQLHYTPTGKEEKDRSRVGLVLYKESEPPKHNVMTHGIGNHQLRIPAEAANHEVSAQMTVPKDALLLALIPHMHLRGKDFSYTATYPDGRTEILLSVPRYDFSWQSTYRFAEPKAVPKGTRIDCVAHFDNSKDNPANPDPTKTITWGEQTWDEMMVGYVDYTWAEPMQNEPVQQDPKPAAQQ